MKEVTHYEFIIEWVDAAGDITNVDHPTTAKELFKQVRKYRTESSERIDIGLVRTSWIGSGRYRSWAYAASNDELPAWFLGSQDEPVARIPQRLQKEWKDAQK